jgi:hypothetical protein
VRQLLDGDTPRLRAEREIIAERTTREMIDFDRLTPMERRYLQPVLFVWPFLRGAFAWPIDYVKHYPERAGLITIAASGYGASAREELGDVPDYLQALVPIDKEKGVAFVANMGSVSPTSALSELLTVMYATGASAVADEKMPAFVNLMNYIAPQYQALVGMVQGRGEFGQQEGLRSMTTENLLGTMIPFWGLGADVIDEERPKTQIDQGLGVTLLRRTVRFSPQRLDLALLNQQAEEGGAKKTPQQVITEKVTKARSAWKHISPTTPMPREIERSIQAFQIVSDMRQQLQQKLTDEPGFRPEPGHREAVLTELQEASIVFDVFKARYPDMVAEGDVPDPDTIYARVGEEGMKRYRSALERVMFRGKNLADKAVRMAKRKQELEAAA